MTTKYLTEKSAWQPLANIACIVLTTVGLSGAAGVANAKVHVSASFNADHLQLRAGKARYRSVNRYDANYERYRRDCAEYLSKYGTGKSCQFPQRGNNITIIQNNHHYGSSRYGYTHYPNTARYGYREQPVIVVNVDREQPPVQYSSNGFRKVQGTTTALPAGWSRDLRRGDILDIQLYQRGRVTYRSPRGVVRIKLGNTTIQLKEQTREIISVINR